MGNRSFRVTPSGAFNDKERKPGEKTKDGAMPDIFKLQRPLFTTEEEPKILVYNQSRSWEGQIPITPELLALFGDQAKIYIIATPQDDGKLIPIELISEQPW